MDILIASVVLLYIQTGLIILFLKPSSDQTSGITILLLIWLISPIFQVFLGYLVIDILGRGTNSYAMAFGAGFALLIFGLVVAFISGFLITPLILRILGVRKKRGSHGKSTNMGK